ncbi:MAG: site-specific integrase [Oscillospiraceae bacterium]|nr:site-specific integrase [Oscillospiraceae bacterium]
MKKTREYGTGSVSQRKDGYWVGRITAGKKPDGKPDVRVVYGKTENEAKRKLKELIKQLNRSDYVYVQKSTVQSYMDDWLFNVKSNELKPKSFDRLEQTLVLDVYPQIGQIQLQALTPGDVQKMVNNLRDNGRSYSTIKKAYDAVNGCFSKGVQQKTVVFNPASGVTVPSKKQFTQKDIPFYTEAEAKILTKQAMSYWGNGKRRYPLGAFVPLLINTGLRLGELLALKWDRDIDLVDRTLTVRANMAIVRDRSKKADKKYKYIEQDSVKTDAGQDRSIPLNDEAYNAILDLQKKTGNCSFVMTTSNGTLVKPRQLDQMFRRIAVAAGIKEEKVYGVHALRHTFATLLLQNNVDIKTVSKLLGHSNVPAPKMEMNGVRFSFSGPIDISGIANSLRTVIGENRTGRIEIICELT